MPYALDEPHYRLLGPEAAARGAAQPRPGLPGLVGQPHRRRRCPWRDLICCWRGVVLFAAVIAVPLASRLGIGAVLGYLLAGSPLVRGGSGLSAMWMKFSISELGVVFLMFIIGLSSIAKLWRLRSSIFGVGARR